MDASNEKTLIGARRWYVLFVLMVAYTFSLMDRQILTILAGPIKKDLGLSDAELGLLYGTAFAVFYSLFGIPLGRLADGWVRTRLMALGLLGWSCLTVFSGFAANLAQLAVARLGVGIGEASANPAAYSLISDYFPDEKRATAIAIYTLGVSFGIGGSLWFGGSIVDLWHGWFGSGVGPLGLKAWQAAFVILGAPGILVAALIWSLREPPRVRAAHPWRGFFTEIFSVLPPFTLLSFAALRPPVRSLITHVLVAVSIAAVAAGMIVFANGITPPAKLHVLFQIGGMRITSHALQWTALGVGIYGIFSWTQSLALRDAPTHALLWRSPTMVPLLAAAALEMVTTYGLTAWAPLYAVTRYHLPLSTVGLELGGISAATGIAGTYLGGALADLAQKYSPRGRLYVSFFGQMAPVPLVPLMLSAHTLTGMLTWWILVGTLTTMWYAGTASATQDLVLPRMRGTAAAVHTLCMTMIGLGLGPYLAGLVSDATGSLFYGILSVYAVAPLIAIFMITAIVNLPRTQANLAVQAAAVGERR
jgi:MFS family permease